MAAWLAYLKSRLLLPEPPSAEGPSAEDLATALANRLRRLEQIREASNRLMTRPQLRRDIFPRGFPEQIAQVKHQRWTATLYDLLTAYATQRQYACWRPALPSEPSGRCRKRVRRLSGWSARRTPRTGRASMTN